MKDFIALEKGLNYIEDLETFLNVIEVKKEDIYNKYNSKKIEKIIKVDDLKFKKDELEDEEDEQQSESITSDITIKNVNQDTEKCNPYLK